MHAVTHENLPARARVVMIGGGVGGASTLYHFQGRNAIAAQRDAGHRRQLVALEVENDIASAHTGDPIYAGDHLIGVVTSGAYGHTTGINIALGYVEPDWSEPGTELSVDIIGRRSAAVVRTTPMFDPANLRPRADTQTRS